MRFRVLGPVEVQVDGSWSSISATKWRTMLAVLLLRAGEVVPTEQLIGEVWPEDTPATAVNLISVYVLRLRRLIGDAEGQLLVTRSRGYQLLAGPGDVDAQRFARLAAEGRAALSAGDSPRAADLLGEALGLWQGSRALADVPDSALVSAAASGLEEARVEALELRINADLGCGAPGAGGGGAARAALRAPAPGRAVGAAHARPVQLGPAGRGPGGLRPGPRGDRRGARRGSRRRAAAAARADAAGPTRAQAHNLPQRKPQRRTPPSPPSARDADGGGAVRGSSPGRVRTPPGRAAGSAAGADPVTGLSRRSPRPRWRSCPRTSLTSPAGPSTCRSCTTCSRARDGRTARAPSWWRR